MAFPSVSHPCLPLWSPWNPVSTSRTGHLSFCLWRVQTGIMESSKRHSHRPVPMEWTQPSMETGHAAGTGDGTTSCRAELVMASCLIQNSMMDVAKPVLPQGRVKSDPGPGEGEQVAIDDSCLQGFTHVHFGRDPGAGFHHCRSRKASGHCSKESGAGEATISSACLFWLLIFCH